MTANPMSRFFRRVFPGRNPLATYGDRIEGGVLALAVVVAFLAVPVAGAVGSEAYGAYKSRVEVEQANRTQVDAVLVEDAPELSGRSEGAVETTSVTATYQLPDGTARTGLVPASYDAASGATVRIWIDRNGEVVEPPMTRDGAVISGFVMAFLLWGGVSGAMALLYVVVKYLHTRIRLRRWRLAWELTAPDWTGRC
jgi:hypothetical protein